MKVNHRFDSSPKSDHDDDNNKTAGESSLRSPRIPNFKQIDNDMNGRKLVLPEESKLESEPRQSVFKIDFANDPVMRSLLEAKQDQ
jgi:hypothetical protein